MNSKKILVIVAHPDDEILGMGGTLLMHKDKGDEISLVVLSNGEDSRPDKTDPKKRYSQSEVIAEKLGAKLFICNFPDQKFDVTPILSINQEIEKVLKQVKPDVVYTHHAYDLNSDHRRTFESVLTACRPQPDFSVTEIYSFEVLSSTEWQKKDHQSFCPNYYVSIDCYLEGKKVLMKEYKDELREYPHPRSLRGIETLAHYRGQEVGLAAAEAFEIIRIIQK
jgi:LmbE family N-acetylglucosaminyl deacetylase